MSAPNLKVSGSLSLRKRVADILRNAIAQGEFDPGERLVERILCERIGVSRTSLREALRELENEGLVTNLPNKGVIISTLTRREAKAIFDVRAAMEALVCRLFCEVATSEQLLECKEAFDGVVSAYDAGIPREMITAKAKFYDVLLLAVGNDIAERTLRSVHLRVSQLRMTSLASESRRRASLVEMQALMLCLTARDGRCAEQLSRHHVEQAALHALSRLAD